MLNTKKNQKSEFFVLAQIFLKSGFLGIGKTFQKSTRILWCRIIWRVYWRKKIDSRTKNEPCEKFAKRGSRGFWKTVCRSSGGTWLYFRIFIITYSDSAFHAEQEYVVCNFIRLYLGSQNCILRKTSEKIGFSEPESNFGFSGTKIHLEKIKTRYS